MEQKNLEYYLKLPYKVEVFTENDPDDPGFVASIPDLPGCITQADTFAELGEMIEDAKRSWLEAAIEHGISIPEPRPQEDYSGKFVVRVPRSLHRKLVEEAESEGVSLNQYINVSLAGAINPLAKSYSADKPIAHWFGLSETIKSILSSSGFDTDAENLDQRLFCERVGSILQKINLAVEDQNYYAAFSNLDKLIEDLSKLADQQPVIDLLATAMRSWRNHLNRFTLQILSSPPPSIKFALEQKGEIIYTPPPLEESYMMESDAIQDLFAKVNKKSQGNSNE